LENAGRWRWFFQCGCFSDQLEAEAGNFTVGFNGAFGAKSKTKENFCMAYD
jgi:cell division protein FtsN